MDTTNRADEWKNRNITPLLDLQTSYACRSPVSLRWITPVLVCSWASVDSSPQLWRVSHQSVEGVCVMHRGWVGRQDCRHQSGCHVTILDRRRIDLCRLVVVERIRSLPRSPAGGFCPRVESSRLVQLVSPIRLLRRWHTMRMMCRWVVGVSGQTACQMGEVGRYRQQGVHNLSCLRGSGCGIVDVDTDLTIVVAFFCMFAIPVGSVDGTLGLLWRIERRCSCLHNGGRGCRLCGKWKGRCVDNIVSVSIRQDRW